MSEAIIKGNQNTTLLLNELKRSSKQYPCLSKDEEDALINQYYDDRETLNKLLFMHNIRAVFSQAKKYMSKVDNFDSLVQDGMVGLGEACKRFDPSKGVKFITYAQPWIRKYILSNFYGKNIDVEKSSISLDSPMMMSNSKSSGENDVTFENYVNEFYEPSCVQPKTLEQELSSNEQIEICKHLYDVVENDTTLSAMDKEIFTAAFYNKEKTRDIADKYNIEMSEVNDVKHKILSKLKDVMATQYGIHSYDEICA